MTFHAIGYWLAALGGLLYCWSLWSLRQHVQHGDADFTVSGSWQEIGVFTGTIIGLPCVLVRVVLWLYYAGHLNGLTFGVSGVTVFLITAGVVALPFNYYERKLVQLRRAVGH